MLFVKKCQSAFPARGKKADTLLPRQRRRSSGGGGQRPVWRGHRSCDPCRPQGSPWPCAHVQEPSARCPGTFWGEGGHPKPAAKTGGESTNKGAIYGTAFFGSCLKSFVWPGPSPRWTVGSFREGPRSDPSVFLRCPALRDPLARAPANVC